MGPPVPAAARRPRRLARGLAATAFALVASLLLAEIALQVAAAFAPGRADPAHPHARHRILTVGDSHTYGAGVPAEESYPAHLQRLLDERAPGAYGVVNLGVPGANTSQVRNRLAVYAGHHAPSTIVVWCGINNAWNVSEVDDASGWTALDGLASRSRLYRLLRVWLHDRRLERSLGRGGSPLRPAFRTEKPARRGPTPAWIERQGRRERFGAESRPYEVDAAMEQRAERDFEAMAAFARSAGIRIVFVTYPIETDAFGAANRAVRRAAQRTGAPVVEGGRALERVPPERRAFLWSAHPTGPIYAAIARDVLPRVLEPGDG